MTYTLAIHPRRTYLHAVVTGVNSRENVERYLDELLHECEVRGCFMVLIEERLEGPRLQTFDVFEIAMQATAKARKAMRAVAYVDVYAAAGGLMRFAETVAVNRGLPVAVFPTVDAAEQWLAGLDAAGGGPGEDAPAR